MRNVRKSIKIPVNMTFNISSCLQSVKESFQNVSQSGMLHGSGMLHESYIKCTDKRNDLSRNDLPQ